eukprot:scaffold630_cov399-Prasinococcus_capsulatus_cf.AAC.13
MPLKSPDRCQAPRSSWLAARCDVLSRLSVAPNWAAGWERRLEQDVEEAILARMHSGSWLFSRAPTYRSASLKARGRRQSAARQLCVVQVH